MVYRPIHSSLLKCLKNADVFKEEIKEEMRYGNAVLTQDVG